MESSAALIIDMQHGFCSLSGSLGPSPEMAPVYRAAVSEAARLAEAAHRAAIPVIYLRHVYRPGHPEMSKTFKFRDAVTSKGALLTGSADASICDELPLATTDLLLDKSRFDSFLGTELDLILRSRGITSLVVAGVSTNVCVESTVRSASERGYRVHVASDATAATSRELHEAALRSMEYAFGSVGPWTDFFRQ